jgi:hypothetical protein
MTQSNDRGALHLAVTVQTGRALPFPPRLRQT